MLSDNAFLSRPASSILHGQNFSKLSKHVSQQISLESGLHADDGFCKLRALHPIR